MKSILHKWRGITLLILLAHLVSSCNDNDGSGIQFAAAFESTSLGISEDASTVEVTLSFTKATTVTNEIVIDISESGVTYGTEYETDPAAEDGQIVLEVAAGVDSASFTVERIVDYVSSGNTVTFTITSVSGEKDPLITGNTSVVVSFEAITSVGGTMDAEIGGPTEPNQVFVDLSLNSQVAVERTSWDLGFYTGSDNRVILNYGTYMAAAPLSKTDITEVTAEDTVGMSTLVAVGTFNPDSEAYIDSPDGDLSNTAIDAISSTADENVVYILNLGVGPGTTEPSVGSVNTTGTARGWKKVKFQVSGDDYILQYADIDATTYSEVTISRDELYDFVYFSFDANSVVEVSPAKELWDIQFTIYPEIITGYGPYGYNDFIIINNYEGIEVTVINTESDTDAESYSDFSASNLADITMEGDRNSLGSTWRSTRDLSVYDYIYFVIRDTEGNYYKMQVQSIINDEGVRGYTSFKYELLQ